MTSIRGIVMVSGLCSITVGAHAATFQGVGDLPGGAVSSTIGGVSADGNVVVGTSSSANGTTEAFRWNALNGIVGLGDLAGGSFSSSAQSASADGSAIVGSATDATGEVAYRWDAVNGMIPLNSIVSSPGFFTVADVSGDGGVMAGTGVFSGDITAIRWDSTSGAVNLGSLPSGPGEFGLAISADGSVVVGRGNYSLSVNHEAFRWDAVNGMVKLLSPHPVYYAEAHDANADGSVIVGYMNYSAPQPVFSSQRGFRWTAATGMVSIGNLGSNNASQAFAVNADGTVIVGSGNITGGALVATIWRDGIGLQRLSTVLTDEFGLDITGWNLQSARGISADGLVIVGNGTNPQGASEAWVANLRAPAPACAGDVTGDGETNISDFNVVSLNFGQAVTPNTNGDLTGDGIVNIADFNILAGDFGCGAE